MPDEIPTVRILGPAVITTPSESDMPSELTDLTPGVHNLLLKSGSEMHNTVAGLIQTNAASAASIVQHTAARQLNEVDAIESAATEKVLKVQS